MYSAIRDQGHGTSGQVLAMHFALHSVKVAVHSAKQVPIPPQLTWWVLSSGSA